MTMHCTAGLLVPPSPLLLLRAGCGGPALLHTVHHVITTTAAGTPLCWRFTRCHRVLHSQVIYELIGMGVCGF